MHQSGIVVDVGCGNFAKGGGCDAHRCIGKIGLVSQIEYLGAELHLDLVAHYERLESRDVAVAEVRSNDLISARVTERSRSLRREGRLVEPRSHGFRAGRVRIAYLVWTISIAVRAGAGYVASVDRVIRQAIAPGVEQVCLPPFAMSARMPFNDWPGSV